MNQRIRFSVFTKPWPGESVPSLAKLVQDMGFEAVELPVRPGFQVTPDNVDTALPELVSVFADHGLSVASVASSLDESIFAACAAAQIPMIRIMGKVARGHYRQSLEELRSQLAGAAPLCERYRVQVGVQEHYGDNISDAFALKALLDLVPTPLIGAVWDAAHDALAGVPPETGLDAVWDRLLMVNLKNAFYERTNGAEAEVAEWRRHFTAGHQGLASWPLVAAELLRRDFSGVVCLTAEYEEPADVERMCRADLTYAKGLLA